MKTGRTTGGRVEILAGLNTGELVVLAPPAALRDAADACDVSTTFTLAAVVSGYLLVWLIWAR